MPRELFTRSLTLTAMENIWLRYSQLPFTRNRHFQHFPTQRAQMVHELLCFSCSIYRQLLWKFAFLEVSVNTFCTQQNSNSVITIVSYVTFSKFCKTAFPSSNTTVLIQPISEHLQTFRAQKHQPIPVWGTEMLLYFY